MKKKNRTVIFIFALIFLSIFSFLIGNAFAQIRTEVGKSNGWREIQFNFGNLEPPYFVFHPSGKQLILGGKGGKGISLLDIESGSIQELTMNVRHKYPSCSNDGRYIFFTESSKKNYQNLYLYDTKAKKIELIYKLDKPLPIFIINEPISPSGKYLIGPANWKEKITLPGGEIVIVVPIHGTIEVGKLPKYLHSYWSSDSSKLFLYHHNMQTISVRDLKTNEEIEIPIRIEGFSAGNIKPGPDPTKVYIKAVLGEDQKAELNLYMMNLINPEKIPVVIIKNARQFDIDLHGTIVFSRIDKAKGFNQLYIMDKTGKTNLIKQFRSFTWDWPIIPHISKDGKVVAFFRKFENEEKVITVLVKEDK